VVEELSRLVEQFGRIKLAPGIAGKSAYVAIAALIVLGVLAFRIGATDRVLVFALIAAVIVLVLIPIVAMIVFAWHNPGASLLEGAELVAWQQHEHAAKGVGVIPERPPVPEPTALPSVEEPEP